MQSSLVITRCLRLRDGPRRIQTPAYRFTNKVRSIKEIAVRDTGVPMTPLRRGLVGDYSSGALYKSAGRDGRGERETRGSFLRAGGWASDHTIETDLHRIQVRADVPSEAACWAHSFDISLWSYRPLGYEIWTPKGDDRKRRWYYYPPIFIRNGFAPSQTNLPTDCTLVTSHIHASLQR